MRVSSAQLKMLESDFSLAQICLTSEIALQNWTIGLESR